MTKSKHADEIAQPIKEQSTESLPSALTFFLHAHQRRALLKALRAYSNDRSQAILIALGITETK